MSAVTGLDTPEQAIAALEAVVEKIGADYTYPQRLLCSYVIDGQPSCIVGRVMVARGLDVNWLAQWESNAVSQSAVDLCLEIGIPEEVGLVLAEAQEAQDGRQRWGDALDAARQKASAFVDGSVIGL